MSPSLDEFFCDSVRQHPARPALFIKGRSWSYWQMDTVSSSIERQLHIAGPSGRGRNIGLLYGRSVFTYAAIIAIMRSGNVYVPLNATLPAERLLKILTDAHIETLLIDPVDGLADSLLDALRRSQSLDIVTSWESDSLCELILAETPRHTLRRVCFPDRELMPTARARLTHEGANDRIAYIIYTSGSTGVPKGVAITHASACGCIEKSHRLFATDEQDRFTQFSALSFDVSILDLFLCWKSGAALYVPEASQALVPLEFVVRHALTVWSSVPSLANILLKLRLLKQNGLPRIRLMLFCGEALPCELAAACAFAAPDAQIFNLYGPTECTIFATHYEYRTGVDPSRGTVPIGAPLPGVQCVIIDDDRPIEEEGVPGELWISGDQLAVGYWNNPAATEAAFVQYPPDGKPATRWYRTGDLVSRGGKVGLQFHGRRDRQVKLRGHRIELQEIEAVLREVIGCALVAIVPVRNSGGICEKIIAYCDRLGEDEATLKERCLSRIPRYMVPDRMVELDRFPLSSSGKIDYLSLATQAPVSGPPVTGKELSHGVRDGSV